MVFGTFCGSLPEPKSAPVVTITVISLPVDSMQPIHMHYAVVCSLAIWNYKLIVE